MKLRAAMLLFSLLALWGWCRPARADSVAERFAAAKLEFEYKNFDKAIEKLTPLLNPGVLLSREADIVAAREMLGLAHFYLGHEKQAREEFVELLYLRPKHELDAFLVPPPAVKFFSAIRNEPAMKEKLERIERERREAAEKAKQAKKIPSVVRRIYLERSNESHWRFLTFMPFGIGQFQNGHEVKGYLILAAQSLALIGYTASVALLVAIRGDDRLFPEDQRGLVEGAYISQFVCGGLFGALWIYGAIDANIYYSPQVVQPFERVREEVEKPEPKQPAPTTGLMPTAYPGGAGLSFSKRF